MEIGFIFPQRLADSLATRSAEFCVAIVNRSIALFTEKQKPACRAVRALLWGKNLNSFFAPWTLACSWLSVSLSEVLGTHRAYLYQRLITN